MTPPELPALSSTRFRNPEVTADGRPRAFVSLKKLETLWINTGSLCNITCANCYIESSPRNDRLVYLTADEVRGYLDEIVRDRLGTRRIGFTGGEPFMNPQIMEMVHECLSRRFEVLVLTNAMKPMMRWTARLIELKERFGHRLGIRVSADHYAKEMHERERGPRSWEPMIEGLRWLSANGFNVSVAGRTCWGEPEAPLREGYARLFEKLKVRIDHQNIEELVLFPEMDERLDVPEITTGCWEILGKSPHDVMCASSRMVLKRKGASHPMVVSCTLIPYDERFEMGPTLADASKAVRLNHPHCSRFCVLGGGACSR
jgi:uncharacterized Fe-S cluster-containing radical SAM superfamily protein